MRTVNENGTFKESMKWPAITVMKLPRSLGPKEKISVKLFLTQVGSANWVTELNDKMAVKHGGEKLRRTGAEK